MKHELLVVSEDESAVEPLLNKLAGMELSIERRSSFASAIEALQSFPRPDSVVMTKSFSTPGVLELMVALDEVPPTIPVIVLDDDPVDPSVQLSPELIWHQNREYQTLPPRIASAFGSPTNIRSVRRPVDYLVCAMTCLRSVGLRIILKSGGECLFELIGGDLWNVYSEGVDGNGGLEKLIQEPVARAEVRKIHMIPGERQIYQAGILSLVPQPMEPATEQEDFGTNEFPVGQVIEDLKAAGELPVAASKPDVADTEKPAAPAADSFDDILTRGIKASLSRNYPRAAELFQQALELRPHDTKAKFNLEQVQKRLTGN